MVMASSAVTIGILAEDLEVPTWWYLALRHVLEQDGVRLLGIYQITGGQDRKDSPSLGYRLFRQLDEKLFSARPDAMSPRNLGELVEEPAITQGNAAALVESLKKDLPDLLLTMDTRQLPEELLTVCPYGIWSYVLHDASSPARSPAAFWESAAGQHVVGFEVRWQAPEVPQGRVLSRCWTRGYMLSPTRSANRLYWSAIDEMARQVRRLQRQGAAALMDAATESPPLPRDEPPSTGETVNIALRYSARLLRQALFKNLHKERWSLLYQFGEQLFDPRQATALMPPDGMIWADPMLIEHEGRYVIFVEEMPIATGKGHLVAIPFDAERQPQEAVPVMKTDYHLSYPVLIRHDDELYMMPETCQNRTLDLYVCKRFPDQWELAQTLMRDCSVVDATPLFHEGTWWLFMIREAFSGSGSCAQLHLYYSPDLLTTDWTPHPLNPVITDPYRARPAGAIFRQDGKLMRPSQDCTSRYGHAIHFNEILTLTTEAYEERCVRTLWPDWDEEVKGTHTYAQTNDMKVIDVLHEQRKYL